MESRSGGPWSADDTDAPYFPPCWSAWAVQMRFLNGCRRFRFIICHSLFPVSDRAYPRHSAHCLTHCVSRCISHLKISLLPQICEDRLLRCTEPIFPAGRGLAGTAPTQAVQAAFNQLHQLFSQAMKVRLQENRAGTAFCSGAIVPSPGRMPVTTWQNETYRCRGLKPPDLFDEVEKRPRLFLLWPAHLVKFVIKLGKPGSPTASLQVREVRTSGSRPREPAVRFSMYGAACCMFL